MFGELIEKAKVLATKVMQAAESRSRVRTRYQVAGSLLAALTMKDQINLKDPKIRAQAIEQSLQFARDLEAKAYEDASDDDLDFDL